MPDLLRYPRVLDIICQTDGLDPSEEEDREEAEAQLGNAATGALGARYLLDMRNHEEQVWYFTNDPCAIIKACYWYDRDEYDEFLQAFDLDAEDYLRALEFELTVTLKPREAAEE